VDQRPIAPKESVVDVFVIERNSVLDADWPTVFVDHHHLSADRYMIGMVLKKSHLPTKSIRAAEIIGIHPGKKLGPRLSNELIQGRNDSPVWTRPHANTVVDLRAFAEDVPRTIRRSVVQRKNLEICEILSENTSNGGLQVPLSIINRDDECDRRYNLNVSKGTIKRRFSDPEWHKPSFAKKPA
jgi:hypothetical protein